MASDEDEDEGFARFVGLVEAVDLLGVVHAHASGKLPDLNSKAWGSGTLLDWLCKHPHPHYVDVVRLLVALGARVQAHHITVAAREGASDTFVRALRRAHAPPTSPSRLLTTGFLTGTLVILLAFLWATFLPLPYLSFPIPPVVVVLAVSRTRPPALVAPLDDGKQRDGLFLAMHLSCVAVIGVGVVGLRAFALGKGQDTQALATDPAEPLVNAFLMNTCLVCTLVLQPLLVLAVKSRPAALPGCLLPTSAKVAKLSSLADRSRVVVGDPEGGHHEEHDLLAPDDGPHTSALCHICPTCLIAMPPRSKHCGACGVCVGEFDHHCPFVAACVGQHNRRLFVLALLNSLALSTTFLACSLPLLWTARCGSCLPPTLRFATFTAFVGLLFSFPMLMLQLGLTPFDPNAFKCVGTVGSSSGWDMREYLAHRRGHAVVVESDSDGGISSI